MNSNSCLVIGGDLRSFYLYKMLLNNRKNVSAFLVPNIPNSDYSLEKLINSSKYIICPTPFTKDNVTLYGKGYFNDAKIYLNDFYKLLNQNHVIIGGSIPKETCTHFSDSKISFFDINTFESLKYANGCITAECLLKHIIEFTPYSLCNTSSLVLGYGNCGAPICSFLRNMHSNVSVYNKSPYRRLKALSNGFKTLDSCDGIDLNSYDIIINTIPDSIISKDCFCSLNSDIYFFEISNNPYKFPSDNSFIHFRNCPGLPGSLCPETSAGLIYDLIFEKII